MAGMPAIIYCTTLRTLVFFKLFITVLMKALP